ncbi:MAG: R3H domain-containing nucleic acid-binding protein, partial [Chloroflexota bacterium]
EEEARIRVTPRAPLQEDDLKEQAKQVLEDLLHLLEAQATVSVAPPLAEIESTPPPLVLDVRDGNLAWLIGRWGQNLDALQYILNLILTHQLKASVRVVVDVSGYKRNRYRALRQMALQLAQEVAASGKPVTLEPMSALERRIIHLSLAEHPVVTTQSEGEGENRKVVIQKKLQDA